MELIPPVTQTSQDQSTKMRRLFVLALVGLVVGVGLGYFLWGKKAEAPDKAIPTATSTKSVSEKATLVVDQQMPGDTLLIKYMSIATSTWIVVREDRDGEPGHILGAARFRNQGEYRNEMMTLLQNIEEGKMYYAVAYNDNNGGEFDYQINTPRKGENGKLIMVSFEVISTGSRGD